MSVKRLISKQPENCRVSLVFTRGIIRRKSERKIEKE